MCKLHRLGDSQEEATEEAIFFSDSGETLACLRGFHGRSPGTKMTPARAFFTGVLGTRTTCAPNNIMPLGKIARIGTLVAVWWRSSGNGDPLGEDAVRPGGEANFRT